MEKDASKVKILLQRKRNRENPRSDDIENEIVEIIKEWRSNGFNHSDILRLLYSLDFNYLEIMAHYSKALGLSWGDITVIHGWLPDKLDYVDDETLNKILDRELLEKNKHF